MPTKKLLTTIIVISITILLLYYPLAPINYNLAPAHADTLDTSSSHLDDINKQIADFTKALNDSVAATKPLQSQLDSMQKQITDIKQQVAQVEADTVIKKQQIDTGYKDLTQKETMLNQAIRDFYVKSYYDSPILTFVSTETASQMTQTIAYQHAATNQDKAIITNIALSITDLETKKAQLDQEQKWLVSTKANLDQQSIKLDGVIKGALAYQQNLSSKIQQLSAEQQAILNARSGSFTATIGDSDLADDYNASIKGFRESAPSGSFAVFSFGAFTHRKGMSQYGAFGRAQSGQDYHAILKAYYGKDTSTVDTSGTIQVNGSGAIDFETTYLYGIAEMPSSFPTEALKAQAVAARSYAYRYKQQGQSICTDEGCQVYSASKAANPPDAWKQAVDATKGQIIDGVTTFFSSTTGGYLSTMGWDTTDGGGGSNFADKAYEKIAGSPWFYKAWYTKGYSTSSDKCGRDNPWLSGSDLADIVNASFVLSSGGSDETGRVTPPTTSCWGGNPYSPDELKQIASKYGGGISNVSSVTVLQGDGTTNEIDFQTDKGTIKISGSSFKTAFDIRAPGYLSIPQSGFSFFNIEQK
jgi:peptidoglycan hydrolase-like amidase